ncbi:MAG: hypothetical protein KF764_19370 [Labilithrix sp.]|nr:hypothetical protein [Labilithrix sp.]MBX3222433.1 hypothetical protein [Labilithrix sp.]
MKFLAHLTPLRSCVLALPVFVLACAEHAETAPPARTVAALERGLDEDSVGVSMRPPVRRAPPQFDDADADAVRLFHDVLAPYGVWSDDSRLGLVWIPSRDAIGEAFVPYGTHGRWTHRELAAVTESGHAPFHEWTWVSDLPWGWVTFHYGRWAFTGDRGWAWVAGRRYAGAWVDWRAPHGAGDDGVIGWGPTPPAHVWRISPGPRPTRARVDGPLDPRDARIVPVPYAAFATPYTYARARDVFAPDLGARLLPAAAALAVAYTTDPAGAPSPERLGFRAHDVPAPPAMDRGLQQAWMLATPATATAIGAGPELGPPPRLRTWVAGGTRYAVMR